MVPTRPAHVLLYKLFHSVLDHIISRWITAHYHYFKFDSTQPYFMAFCAESLPQPFFIWKFNWRQQDLNPGPFEDQSKALPTELSWLSSNFEFPFNFVFVLIFLTEGKSYLKTLLNASCVSPELTLLVDCLSELKIENVLIQMVYSFYEFLDFVAIRIVFVFLCGLVLLDWPCDWDFPSRATQMTGIKKHLLRRLQNNFVDNFWMVHGKCFYLWNIGFIR